jgi:hypothetical protein
MHSSNSAKGQGNWLSTTFSDATEGLESGLNFKKLRKAPYKAHLKIDTNKT